MKERRDTSEESLKEIFFRKIALEYKGTIHSLCEANFST